jgi:hypothetical protein
MRIGWAGRITEQLCPIPQTVELSVKRKRPICFSLNLGAEVVLGEINALVVSAVRRELHN